MRAHRFTAMLAVLALARLASAQQAPDRRVTESGKTVTVYSISWPTPISNVVADVEVCAGDNAPQGTFAFPSWFQLHLADGSVIGSAGTAKQPNLEITPLKAKQCAAAGYSSRLSSDRSRSRFIITSSRRTKSPSTGR